MKKIKWGILGAGRIAEKFVSDLAYVSNGEALAVVSQTEGKAEAFANKYGIQKVYSSYAQFVQDPEIDAVYIATPHNFHFEQTKLCLENKKAVLCEKAVTVNLQQLSELQHLATQNNVFYMEAMWTYFLPTMRKAKEWIDAGKIGEVNTIKAEFGFKAPFDAQNRVFNPHLAGGALLDIGIYPIAFSLFFAKGKVKQIASIAKMGTTQIDEENALSILFETGELAVLNSSVLVALHNDGYIYGSKGFIHLPYFWRGSKAVLNSDSETIAFEDKREAWGYNFEAQHVGEMLLQGKTQSQVVSFEHSRELMSVMDIVREQNNFKYPFEK